MLQLVIPAYNEAERLPRTLRELRRHLVDRSRIPGGVQVLVVDNASTDATAAVARAADCAVMPVRVVSCTVPGKGAAVAAGVAATDADLVGFMDADGATDLAALDEAWRLMALDADVAIGSRALSTSVVDARHSLARDVGARVYRRLARGLVPGVDDTQCGFKVLRGDLARAVCAEMGATGFAFDVELLARCQRRGARVTEFPVVWTDVPGSTFVPARHGAQSFRELAQIARRMRLVPATGSTVPVRPSVVGAPLEQPGLAALGGVG